VDAELKVHGAKGLMVDMRTLPFFPSSHLSPVAYDLGGKAAEMIGKEWK
jgi:hypothetical protein